MAQRRRTTKAKRKKRHYAIQVHVNERNGKFSYFYFLAGRRTEATRIRPCNNDTVTWEVLHRKGRRVTRVPFQIEFEVSNPFGVANRVLRSSGGATKIAHVYLDPGYKGNRIFKYSVSTIHFWSDDPDVVPVPPDGGDKRKALSAQNSVALAISGGQLTLTQNAASCASGEITWYWPAAKGKDDFTLKFRNPPPHWPQGVLKSVVQELIVNFPIPVDRLESSDYDIATISTNEAASGSLEIK